MAGKYDAFLRAIVTIPDGDVWINAADMKSACYKGGWNEMGDMVESIQEDVRRTPKRAMPARVSQWAPNAVPEEKKQAPLISPPPRKKSWWQRITSD